MRVNGQLLRLNCLPEKKRRCLLRVQFASIFRTKSLNYQLLCFPTLLSSELNFIKLVTATVRFGQKR